MTDSTRKLVIALGTPEQENRLLPPLEESGEFSFVERCITAEQLLNSVSNNPVDVVLVTLSLHRLSRANIAEIRSRGIDVVVLAQRANDDSLRSVGIAALPLDASPELVRRALMGHEVIQQIPEQPVQVEQTEEFSQPEPDRPDAPLSVITVASAAGSPGRTTVALSLAGALGAVAPTIAVDADVSGPCTAAYLDSNVLHNIYMVVKARLRTPSDWDRVLDEEAQPLARRVPQGRVLCGLPRLSARNEISSTFFSELVLQLKYRYRYVVIDIGSEVLSNDLAIHRAALAVSSQVLVVTKPDTSSLLRTRNFLDTLTNDLSIPEDRVAMVINSYDRRLHASRGEIEWVLGRPAAALIPYDYKAAQSALIRQQPLVLEKRSKAADELLGLADRAFGGDIVLPPEEDRQSRWKAMVEKAGRVRRRKSPATENSDELNTEAIDGGSAVRVE